VEHLNHGLAWSTDLLHFVEICDVNLLHSGYGLVESWEGDCEISVRTILN
jgi:hypothetical protein